MKSLTAHLASFVVKQKGKKMEKKLHGQMKDLAASQEQLLLGILTTQAQTNFGKEYGFAEIRSVAEYRARVPVLDYEKLRPYILEQDRTNKPVLLSENPLFYAVTSGTTGAPKYIPVHEAALKAHKASTNFFLYNFLKDRPRMFDGRILAIVSPAIEGHLESGRSFGSTSGHMYRGMSPLVRGKYIAPASVLGVEDYDLKYLTILRLAMQARDITYISTANPSTLAKIANLIKEHFDVLVDEIERGSFSGLSALDEVAKQDVLARLDPMPARARELRALKAAGKIRMQDIWPDLQAVGVWTGGSSSIFLEQLAGQFSEQTLLRDLGYLSSEFRGSVPVVNGTNAGVPTFYNCFYEFVEQKEWDDGDKKFLGLHQLEDKKLYYVFVTTDYGLYRYNMNDIVQVDGFYHTVPMIRFVQKGKGVTSITGEKLYESQVIQAVMEVEKEMGVDSGFYLMECDPQKARYTLYYELSPVVKDAKIQAQGAEALEACKIFQKRLDEVLGNINIEYAAKRKSGRVNDLRLCILRRGSYENFKKYQVGTGQREGQFKIVALQFAKDIKFDFSASIGWDSDLSDEDNVKRVSETHQELSVNT